MSYRFLFVPCVAAVALIMSALPVRSEVLTHAVDLFAAGDFSQCQSPVGDWIMAHDVAMNPKDEKHLAWKSGGTVAVNGDAGKTTNLHALVEHGDVQLHVEFMVPKGSNSGVYLMGRYEIQVLDSWGIEKPKYSDCGGIYEQNGKNGAPSHGGVSPKVNAAKKPGEWQTYDITFRAPRFDAAGKKTRDAEFVKVVHNGIVIHENELVTGPTRSATFMDEQPTGPLMFQGDHGPVAYRNVRLEPLK